MAANIDFTSLASVYKAIILELREPYKTQKACYYEHGPFEKKPRCSLTTDGFMGSATSVSLAVSEGSMRYDARGCLAAPMVVLTARDSIRLGSHETYPYLPSHVPPLRVYAPNCLNIKTNHLIIGNIEFDTQPLVASLDCSRVSIINFSPEKTSSLNSIVKNWSINPSTTIDLLEPISPKIPQHKPSKSASMDE